MKWEYPSTTTSMWTSRRLVWYLVLRFQHKRFSPNQRPDHGLSIGFIVQWTGWEWMRLKERECLKNRDHSLLWSLEMGGSTRCVFQWMSSFLTLSLLKSILNLFTLDFWIRRCGARTQNDCFVEPVCAEKVWYPHRVQMLLGSLFAILHCVDDLNSGSDQKTAGNLLIKICEKIQNEPKNEKFRSVKLKILTKKFGECTECI